MICVMIRSRLTHRRGSESVIVVVVVNVEATIVVVHIVDVVSRERWERGLWLTWWTTQIQRRNAFKPGST